MGSLMLVVINFNVSYGASWCCSEAVRDCSPYPQESVVGSGPQRLPPGNLAQLLHVQVKLGGRSRATGQV